MVRVISTEYRKKRSFPVVLHDESMVVLAAAWVGQKRLYHFR